MKNSLFRQYDIKWLGTFINLFYMSLPLVGIATNVMEAGTFYGVQKANIHHFAPWLSFQLFMGIVIFVVILIEVGFYLFIYKAYQSFVNHQAYIHNNPVQKDLALIKKHLGIKDEDNK